MTSKELYAATRGNWKLTGKNLKKIKYVLAYYEGVIQEIYEVIRWEQITEGKDRGRWFFDGKTAEDNIRKKYYKNNISNYVKKGPWSFRYIPLEMKN